MGAQEVTGQPRMILDDTPGYQPPAGFPQCYEGVCVECVWLDAFIHENPEYRGTMQPEVGASFRQLSVSVNSPAIHLTHPLLLVYTRIKVP